ncbi:hypothetical protein ACQ4M4_15460 [Leptolyngbya sp. AN02str]|uniref:hypothetical protein n=1 Tax=Leptolyngbya sp. AN02str TaxID=3423363 RepID=UPI003D318811
MNPIQKLRHFAFQDSSIVATPLVGSTAATAIDDSLGQREFAIKVAPKAIFRLLTYIVCTLTALSVASHVGHYVFGFELIELVILDLERNIPTSYAGLCLALCGVLLGVIALHKSSVRDRFTLAWSGLSFLFFMLALDEIVSLHERTILILRNMLNTSGVLYFAWVIPGVVFVLLFAATYFKFWRSLPSRTRNLFLFSGLIFLSGALGMEMVGGFTATSIGQLNLVYALVTTVEEFLEKMGVVFFIYALLLYIKTSMGSVKVNFLNE